VHINTFKGIRDKTLPHDSILSAVKSNVSQQKTGKLNAERYINNHSAIADRRMAQLYTEPTQDIDTLLLCQKNLSAEKFDRLIRQNTPNENANVIFSVEDYPYADVQPLIPALVKNGASLVKRNRHSQTILSLAIINRWDQVIEACLRRDDLNLNSDTFNDLSYLEMVTITNLQRVDLMIKFINRGAIFSPDLLMWAIEKNHSELFLVLIQKNALITYSPQNQAYLFRTALQNGWNDACLAILKNTTLNMTNKSSYGWCLLHEAARFATPAVFAELLKQSPPGALNVETTDHDPRTALQIAFNYGQIDNIALLIQHGADFSGQFGNQNESLLSIALRSDWISVLKAILSHTPLESILVNPLLNNIYAHYGHQQICEFLHIQPNSNKALKIYAQVHLNHMEQKRILGYFRTYGSNHPKIQTLREGVGMNTDNDAQKEACNKTLLTALHMHSKQAPKQAEAKSFRDLPEPLRTRFFA
jgi:ankyrin repeat protein